MERQLTRLYALTGWHLLLVVLALALAAALGAWLLIWVAWTIRPLLAGAASLAVAVWLLWVRRRHRTDVEWREEEWLGS